MWLDLGTLTEWIVSKTRNNDDQKPIFNVKKKNVSDFCKHFIHFLNKLLTVFRDYCALLTTKLLTLFHGKICFEQRYVKFFLSSMRNKQDILVGFFLLAERNSFKRLLYCKNLELYLVFENKKWTELQSKGIIYFEWWAWLLWKVISLYVCFYKLAWEVVVIAPLFLILWFPIFVKYELWMKVNCWDQASQPAWGEITEDA